MQSLPSLTPLRDDLLARLGRGADRDLDLMHGVCTGGAAADAEAIADTVINSRDLERVRSWAAHTPIVDLLAIGDQIGVSESVEARARDRALYEVLVAAAKRARDLAIAAAAR